MEVMTMTTYNNHNNTDNNSSPLVNEIVQGMELARQLRANLGPEYSADTKSALLQQILSSYDKALCLLGHPPTPQQQPQQQLVPAVPSPPPVTTPSSPISFTGSATATATAADLNVGLNANHHYHHPRPDADGIVTSKKRKTNGVVKTEQVRAKPGNGIEDGGIPDDGYNWRKYGQKDILGAKHPRSYYRCTYRGVQNCRATRKVQRTDKDPNLFNISYKGTHTCCVISRQSKSSARLTTVTPTKQYHIHHHQRQQQPLVQNNVDAYQYDYALMVPGFQPGVDVAPTGYSIDTSGMMMMMGTMNFPPTVLTADLTPSSSTQFNNNNNDDFYGTHSSSTSPASFISSSVSGSTYFSPASSSGGKVDMFGRGAVYQQQPQFDSDISEIISAAASVTNSPRIEPDFCLEPWGFSSSFSLDDEPSFYY